MNNSNQKVLTATIKGLTGEVGINLWAGETAESLIGSERLFAHLPWSDLTKHSTSLLVLRLQFDYSSNATAFFQKSRGLSFSKYLKICFLKHDMR